MESVTSSKPVDCEKMYDEVVSQLFEGEDGEPDGSFKQLFIESFTPTFKRMRAARLVYTKKFQLDPLLRRRLNSQGASVYVSPPELSTDIELD